MTDHRKFWEKKKVEIDAEELFTAEVYDFYLLLFDYHNRYYERCRGLSVLKAVSPEPPLVNSADFTFSDQARRILTDALDDITSLIRKHNEGLDFSVLRGNVSDNVCTPEDLIRPLLQHDMEKTAAVAGEQKLGVEEFIFLVVNWMKPFFVAVAEACADSYDEEDWQENYCPLCGSYPDMAEIVDKLEGKRYLHCSLCEHRWMYVRISCTVCSNNDMQSIGYFIASESEERYRIDYCDKCKGYIKTLRIPKLYDSSSFDVVIENLMTAYLDSAAMEKGYFRP
jgi:hypothetical protein